MVRRLFWLSVAVLTASQSACSDDAGDECETGRCVQADASVTDASARDTNAPMDVAPRDAAADGNPPSSDVPTPELDAGPSDGAAPDASATPDAGTPTEAGRAHFVVYHRSRFDPYTRDPSAQEQAWMREHYWRVYGFTPYFDSRTSWHSDAWFYKDAYAIYTDESLATEHPEWILRDADGDRLYIPFACGGGTCPQYAGDFGNPQFRAHWIAEAGESFDHPYRGIMIDDVNLSWRVGNGDGDHVAPIDPRTGEEMTLEDWRRYFAEFMEQVRGAFPDREIVHNALWSADDSDPFVERQLRAADFVLLERGVVDSGITGGSGRYAFSSFLAYAQRRQSDGANVIFFADDGETAAECEYNLAAFFLISGGGDATNCSYRDTPDDWWNLYDVDLGEPLAAFTRDGELYVREYSNGRVVVNPPDAAQRIVDLGATFIDSSGASITAVTLDPATGVVLRSSEG